VFLVQLLSALKAACRFHPRFEHIFFLFLLGNPVICFHYTVFGVGNRNESFPFFSFFCLFFFIPPDYEFSCFSLSPQASEAREEVSPSAPKSMFSH